VSTSGGEAQRVVIKLGGDVVAGAERDTSVAGVAALAARGHRVVVVHGGGPQTSALQQRLGQTPERVGGRRVTDEATLDALKMAVGGKLNIDLCAAMVKAGCQPVGLHGASSLVIEAERRPPQIIMGGPPEPVDLGLVGDVVGVDLALLETLLEREHVPVVACIGASRSGQVFNINADVVANRLAVLWHADALVLVTAKINGVMRDTGDPASRIPRVTQADSEALLADGVISGGMIPKLQESFRALAGGVSRIHIVGTLGGLDLVRALEEPGSVGTVLVSG